MQADPALASARGRSGVGAARFVCLGKHSMRRRDVGAAAYCTAMVAVAMVLVIGVNGLGPLDDHYMFSTLFQGKPFGPYIAPEIGRFFPLTAQEYAVAAKFLHPSAALFYAINAAKLVFCGAVLFACLSRSEPSAVAIAVLFSIAIFSVGIANTVYRLSAGELNELCAMLCVVWAALTLESDDHADGSDRTWVAWLALAVFGAALFYKELTFVFGLVLGCAECLRRWRTGSRRLPLLYFGLLVIAAGYIFFYIGWRLSVATGSYAELHTASYIRVWQLFADSDPFLLFIAVPITLCRVIVIARHAERHELSDSLLLAATAYVACYFALGLSSLYYLLPAYAFALVGVAGTLARVGSDALRFFIVTASLLAFLNTLPVFVVDTQRQKKIVNNHFRFVNDLASWLKSHPPSGENRRRLVLEGVSPGTGIEIIESLRIYMASLGVPESSFDVVGSEPTNDAKLSAFFKVKSTDGNVAKVGDLSIFNPYHVGPPLRRPPSPSRRLVAGTGTQTVEPRWTAAQWGEYCLFNNTRCPAMREQSRGDTTYAAYLVQ